MSLGFPSTGINGSGTSGGSVVPPVVLPTSSGGFTPQGVQQLYIPKFKRVSQVSNPSAHLTIHSSGVGLVSDTGGTNATGSLLLKGGIDFTKPWRFAALIE